MGGARGWVILAAISLARIGFGYQFQTVASLGPDLMGRFHFDYTTLGSLIGAYMIAGVVTALPLGLLARRFGDRPVLGGGLLLMALGGLLTPAFAGPIGIGIGRVIAGVGAVAMTVLQSKVIADWFPGRRLMVPLSITVGAYPVGVGLAQIIAPPLDAAAGWQAPLLLGGAFMAATAALFFASFGPAPEAPPVHRRFSMPGGAECLLMVVAGLIWAAYTSAYSGYLSFTPSLMDVRGEGLALTGGAIALATWGNVVGTLAGGAAAARTGPGPVFFVGTAIMTGAILGMGLADLPLTWSGLLGIPGSMQSGVIVAVGTLSVRPQHRAAGMGIFYTVYYLGGAIIPAACGWVADQLGTPSGAMYAAAVVSALAFPAYLLHRRLSAGEPMLSRA